MSCMWSWEISQTLFCRTMLVMPLVATTGKYNALLDHVLKRLLCWGSSMAGVHVIVLQVASCLSGASISSDTGRTMAKLLAARPVFSLCGLDMSSLVMPDLCIWAAWRLHHGIPFSGCGSQM